MYYFLDVKFSCLVLKTLKEALIKRDKTYKYHEYTVQPEYAYELLNIIRETINEKGWKCDLNFIDTSLIKNMNYLFCDSAINKFNGDISGWDVSNVKDMNWMFAYSKFNGDISQWDVSSVTNMSGMFYKTNFNGDISKWDVSNVKDMNWMFAYSKFNGDISNWDVSGVKKHGKIFKECPLEDQLKKQPKFKD